MAEDARVEPAEMIVKSKVRQILRDAEMRGSEEIWNELGHTVTRSLKAAIRRARANGRKTVKASDF